MTVPYTHDDLGEGSYPEGQGDPGAPDRNIHDEDFHKPFYGTDGPEPYPA